jgi:hypothetical protein
MEEQTTTRAYGYLRQNKMNNRLPQRDFITNKTVLETLKPADTEGSKVGRDVRLICVGQRQVTETIK